MRILITLLLIFTISFTLSAQKTDRSQADEDFTTTPFQDASTSKGIAVTDGYYEIENGEYTEGDLTITLPLSFNPSKNEKFIIDDQAMVMKMSIYSMTGEMIFTKKVTNSWNGKNQNGEITATGLYIYTIDARITPNRTSKFTGFIKVTE
ncbi:MAG: gliding motility-associated C-terminal domain-containing protein [Saprospiraceae bacterium]